MAKVHDGSAFSALLAECERRAKERGARAELRLKACEQHARKLGKQIASGNIDYVVITRVDDDGTESHHRLIPRERVVPPTTPQLGGERWAVRGGARRVASLVRAALKDRLSAKRAECGHYGKIDKDTAREGLFALDFPTGVEPQRNSAGGLANDPEFVRLLDAVADRAIKRMTDRAKRSIGTTE